jgi:ribosomal protein S18 acetylase RimI-like enzyme
MTPEPIARRRVSDSDLPFLLELYASTRAAELALTAWTPEQKQAFVAMQFQAQLAGYRSTYPQANHEIVTMDRRPVGRLYLARLPECLRILDITIATESRNAGIGSAVLKEVLEEAEQAALPVTIYVESFNPSQRLFNRLGFRVVSQESFQLYMERPPA